VFAWVGRIQSTASGRKMYGPPSDCKEKAEGEKTSLRNVFGLLVELSAPGQDVTSEICWSTLK
jgi:hypothetical protein